MKRSLKFLTAITLSLLLVFGSSLGAFAEKNTSIHLHADATGYEVFVQLEGTFTLEGKYVSAEGETTLPLTGGSLYVSTDFSIDVKPFVLYFIIDNVIFNIPENIKEGKEGKGTINYWMTDMPTKNVYYHKNNTAATGTEPVDSYNYFFGEIVEVMSEGNLALSGYQFQAWNTQADGLGTTYIAGNTFEMPGEDVNLYAVWEPIPPTFNVIYNANNGLATGSVPLDANDYHEEDTATVLGNTGNLFVPGYSFEGWNTEADGSGTTYVADNTFEMPGEDVNLYAVWELIPPTFNVIYNANNGLATGSVPGDTNDYYEYDTATVLGNTGDLQVQDHVFGGWNTQANGLGDQYDSGDTFTMPASNVNLYAKWVPELPPPPTPFKVIYNANNGAAIGDVPLDLNSYHEGNSVTILGNTGNLEVEDYSFEGWNTQADGLGTTYGAGDSFNMPGHDVDLYAVWEPIPTYSLTYDGNGASSGTAPAPPTSYTTGTKVIVLGNSGGYEISGMYFDGWNTDANGNGESYAPGMELTIGMTDVVLYAQWSREIPITGTITIQKFVASNTTKPNEIFEFRINKMNGEESYVYNESPIFIEGGKSYVEFNVPLGMYSVEEINIPKNYSLRDPEPQMASIGLEIGYNPIVIFENIYTEPLGSITVNKSLTGDTPPSNSIFTFRLVGPSGEASTTREMSRTGAGTVTFSDLTYGTYTLTEVGLPSNFSIVSGNNVQLSIHDETPNITANITNRYTEPTPPPPPPTPETGIVRVHYIDIDENLLDPIFEFSSPIGNSYNTVARDYEELELVETPENASGTVIDGIIDVFYVYSPGVEPLVILEVEEETPLGPPVVPEEEIVLTEPIPLAPLPQTGQLPAELFYGLGSLISMIGVAFRKKGKNR